MDDQITDTDLSNAFESGDILEADECRLLSMLLKICDEAIPNDMTRHRAIIRGITINHILMKRHMDNLNTQNRKTQFAVGLVAIATLIVAIVQIF